MGAYFVRRILLMIPTLFLSTLGMYLIIRSAPGGPIEQMRTEMLQQVLSGESSSRAAGSQNDVADLTPEQEEQVLKEFGLSKSFTKDYFRWLGGILRLDFGNSTQFAVPVKGLIASKMPISIFFGLLTLFTIYGICIPLGVTKAIKHKSFFDTISSLLVFFGYAIPGYALGCLLLVFVASDWQLLPLGGFVSDNFIELSFFARIKDLFQHAILPLCCYLIGGFAFLTMLMKNQLLDNMASDYVRTALSKGISFKRSVFKHAFDNSLIPIATTFGNQLTIIITGSFLIEKIFNIDGIGLLGFNSLMARDYSVMMGVMVISTFISLLGNIISDLCVAMVDPRVKFG